MLKEEEEEEEEEQGRKMVPGARDQGYDGQRMAVSREYGDAEQVCGYGEGH
jgi:hypothetical protein